MLVTKQLMGPHWLSIFFHFFSVDVKSAQAALDLLNGYKLLEKPLIIEFGRERSKETDAQTGRSSVDPNIPSKQKDEQSCNEKPA